MRMKRKKETRGQNFRGTNQQHCLGKKEKHSEANSDLSRRLKTNQGHKTEEDERVPTNQQGQTPRNLWGVEGAEFRL